MKHWGNCLILIALGVFLFFMVEIMGIRDYPQIWSATYVLVLDIVAKIIGAASVITGLVLVILFEQKVDK
jgi:hypothetical protein